MIYNTYEELKHELEELRKGYGSWFIIPMRNWNSLLKYTGDTLFVRFIIPMRNWNNKRFVSDTEKAEWFIIPMRNWNPLHCMHQLEPYTIYNTYEELKLIS